MEKDVTGRVADLAFTTSRRILAHMEKLVPMGPSRGRFTRSELIEELSKLGTAGVAQMGDQLTPNEQQEILQRAATKEQGSASQQALEPEEETLE